MSGTRSASQAHRQVQVSSPLGDDSLLFSRMVATEAMSELYELDLDLLSHAVDIRPDKILGQILTVAWKWDPDGEERYFSGVAVRFGMVGGEAGLSKYKCALASPLWLMTRNRNSRIFVDHAPKDIVATVLAEYGISAETLEGMGEVLEYCVQYEESDFAFISRLMERYGCYYYHEHANGAVKLHIVEAGHSHVKLPGHDKVEVREPGASFSYASEFMEDWRVEGRVRADAAAAQDYDFKQPRASLEGVKKLKGWSDANGFEIYEYQTGHRDGGAGGKRAEVIAEAARADSLVYRGSGNVRTVSPGFKFEVYGDRAALMEHQNLLATRTIAVLAQDAYETGDNGGVTFDCTVFGVPDDTRWRAPKITPWPRILGPQTAVVVNANGEELDVDEWGRVQVSFNWEREGTPSMRARVSQLWAGAKWGGAAWPRNGQEVIVEHLNGDPDRPIITGRVYNDSARPPFDPSSEASKFTIMSRSTPGGGGFNALEFEDKAGSEHLFLHSQKDTHLRTVEKQFERIGDEEHRLLVGNSMSEYKAERHATVASDDMLSIDGARHLDVGMDLLFQSGMNIVGQAGTNLHLKGGSNVVIEAGSMLTLKVGGSFITLTSSGIFIQGSMTNINMGGPQAAGPGTSPQKATKPQEPMEGEPGAEAPAARGRDWQRAKRNIASNPAAAVMLAAAQSGAPFCEVCEKAKREQEAGGSSA